MSYLMRKYPAEVVTRVTEWWEEDLDEVGRALCTPRYLERLIALHVANEPLENALPLKVPLHDLRTRLQQPIHKTGTGAQKSSSA